MYNEIKLPHFLSIVKGDNSKSFSRNRKVGPNDIMSYLLNKKGILFLSLEIYLSLLGLA